MTDEERQLQQKKIDQLTNLIVLGECMLSILAIQTKIISKFSLGISNGDELIETVNGILKGYHEKFLGRIIEEGECHQGSKE